MLICPHSIPWAGLVNYIFCLNWLSRRSLRTVHRLGACLGALVWYLPITPKQVARDNITLAFPKLKKRQIDWLLKNSLKETGKTFAELGHVWCTDPSVTDAMIVDVRGQSAVAATMAAGRGVIIAAPHIGQWELLGMHLADHYQLTGMYKPQKGELDSYIKERREQRGSNLVPSDHSGVKALLLALKKGRMIAILPDQDPGHANGVFAPFFSTQANTPFLVARLAKRMNAKVFFAYAERLENSAGYRVHYLPAPAGVYSDELEVAARALNEGTEQCIRKLPLQYWWVYPRYRNRPEGQPPIYKKH